MNIAIYTNILTPYRKFFYDSLYKECIMRGDKFTVLIMAETEPNRSWKYDDFKTEYTILLKGKTMQFGETYIHFNNSLQKELEELKLDILICAGGYLCPGIWKALWLKKRLGYTTYFWSESHLNEKRNYNNFKIKIRDLIRSMIYKRFDGFWYAGKLSKQFIKLYCKRNADMYFVPNLIEEARYDMASQMTKIEKSQLRKRHGIEEDKKVFICPARLSYVKGIDKFISVFAKCPEKEKAVILIAGEGELKDKIKEQVRELNIDVRLLGYQDQNAIVKLYAMSDIFLLPSLSDPNPLTCIEALWSGLPLFISRHCGNYPEVVEQGENGYVFSYENEAETMECLNKLINASEKWISHAMQVSREIAREKYDSTKVVYQLVKYFHEKTKNN